MAYDKEEQQVYLKEYGEAYLLYSIYKSLCENYEQALIYSKGYLNAFPDDPEGIYNYGVINYFLQNSDKALSSLLKVSKISTDKNLLKCTYYYIALVSKEFNQDQAIIDFCEKALEIDKLMYECYLELAYIDFKKGEYLDAIKNITKCIQSLRKKNPNILNIALPYLNKINSHLDILKTNARIK